MSPLPAKYLNRLSDLLFILSRYANLGLATCCGAGSSRGFLDLRPVRLELLHLAEYVTVPLPTFRPLRDQFPCLLLVVVAIFVVLPFLRL